ncbi:MinD/ParA family protein, partial [Aduncisulcus paluster]
MIPDGMTPWGGQAPQMPPAPAGPPVAFPQANWNAPAAPQRAPFVPGQTPFTAARPEAPVSGWRKAVHRLSGGAINPGESSEESHRSELIDRINLP